MTLTVVHKNPICSFDTDWLAPIVNQYMSFVPWDSEKTYAPGTVFYANCLDSAESIQQLQNQNYRVVIDNLWEVDPGSILNTHRITCDAWFWYNESLWYRHLGYDRYIPQRDYQYRALMPMNKHKPHRDDFVQRVDLDCMLWSYASKGRQLPGDQDMSKWDTQRFMNPSWYNQSYASMVVESLVRPGSKYTPVFVTEKTFKPIAFEHPFIVYGNRGTLRKLHNWGFESWDHLWDESYDEIVDVDARRDAVVDLINQIEIKEHTLETQSKLKHNRSRFFDTELVHAGITKEIIEPILHYAETNL